MKTFLAVIGGSGLYDLPGLVDVEEIKVASPWGEPSDNIRVGRIGETRLAFLPRHGRGHVLSPSDINYRANVDALKRLGVTDVVSISACGSFREDLPPGTFVLVDQFVDRTHKRESSFFGRGCVVHVSLAHPTSKHLMDWLENSSKSTDVPMVRGGTYLAMEGPQFSSQAESLGYKAAGYSVIGMTNMPEAKLVREAEMAYASVAMVTDFDCWHPDHDAVDVASVIEVMKGNGEKARRLVAHLAQHFPAERASCEADIALEYALITAKEARDPHLLSKLDAVAGRVL